MNVCLPFRTLETPVHHHSGCVSGRQRWICRACIWSPRVHSTRALARSRRRWWKRYEGTGRELFCAASYTKHADTNQFGEGHTTHSMKGAASPVSVWYSNTKKKLLPTDTSKLTTSEKNKNQQQVQQQSLDKVNLAPCTRARISIARRGPRRGLRGPVVLLLLAFVAGVIVVFIICRQICDTPLICNLERERASTRRPKGTAKPHQHQLCRAEPDY